MDMFIAHQYWEEFNPYYRQAYVRWRDDWHVCDRGELAYFYDIL